MTARRDMRNGGLGLGVEEKGGGGGRQAGQKKLLCSASFPSFLSGFSIAISWVCDVLMPV